MDSAGRLVVPKAVRERYGLVGAPHELELVETAEGIMLRPRAETIPAVRHPSGWVVFQSGDEETVDPVALVEADRERRHRHVVDPEGGR